MDDVIIGIYGASGFGRQVIYVVNKTASQSYSDFRIVFVDDRDMEESINGYKVMPYSDFILQPEKNKKICLAISNSRIREELDDKLREDGIGYYEVEAESVLKMDDVTIDKGAIICPSVTFTSNIKVGNNFHANIYSYVAHDCVIGDFVTFAPRVSCNGNVHIHDHAYIGTGAVLKQGAPDRPLTIGRGAVVGMGAVVTKDVPAGQVVVGNPAKPLDKK